MSQNVLDSGGYDQLKRHIVLEFGILVDYS